MHLRTLACRDLSMLCAVLCAFTAHAVDLDGDGLDSPRDVCPDIHEDFDGFQDEDGCPENNGQNALDCFGSDVYFAANDATISSQSRLFIQDIARFLQDYPSVHIRIEGHSDDLGSNKANEKLSEDRAKHVHKMLIELGISPGRLESVGYGEERPAVDIKGLKGQALDDARARNRRVIFATTKR